MVGRIQVSLVILFIISLIIPGCELTKEASLEERNKQLIRLENKEIGTKGNLEIIDELFTIDVVRHFLPDGSETKGLEALRDRIANHRKAFPDWAEEIKLIVAEGDFVAIHWTSTGTNTGSFRGNPPTGQKIKTNDMSIFQIVDGKIIEQWLLPDLLSLNQQLELGLRSESNSDINSDTSQAVRMQSNGQVSSREQNKELVRRDNEEVWNKGRLEIMDELYSTDFVRHFLPTGSETKGLEELRSQIRSHRQAFPDWAEEIKQIVAEGDLVLTHFSSTGTNEGSFMGNPPTGKKIHINEMSIVRIIDGKIVEQWLLPDILSLNQQLGFISQSFPSPDQGKP